MKQASKFMTPDQFKSGLRLLNMTYSGFARWTGKDTQTVYLYASGRQAIPKLVADTLRRGVEEGQVPQEFQRKRRSREQMQEAVRERFGHGTL